MNEPRSTASRESHQAKALNSAFLRTLFRFSQSSCPANGSARSAARRQAPAGHPVFQRLLAKDRGSLEYWNRPVEPEDDSGMCCLTIETSPQTQMAGLLARPSLKQR